MNPVAAIYIFTIVLMSAEIGWILTRGYRNAQTFSFVACQVLLNIWSASQIMLLEAVNVHQLFLSYCIGNFAICSIGTAWLTFSFMSVGKRPVGPVLFSGLTYSLVMWFVSITNKYHNLFYSKFSMSGVEHGVFFYLNIIYTYFCMIYGTFLLFKSVSSDKQKRKQMIFLILSAVIPFVANVLFIFGTVNVEHDITPFAFSVSSVFVLLATNRYGFLNINDIAFENALENIEEGAAVFRKDGTLSYSNKTMKELFKLSENSTITDLFGEKKCIEKEIEINNRVISLKTYDNFDRKGNIIALTVVATDITRFYDEARQKQALSDAEQKLAVESERNRIAQEVHDTAGHTLTMINSLAKLIYIAADNGDSDDVKQYSQEAQSLSSQGIAQLRVSINNLRKKSEKSLITDGLHQLVNSVRGLETQLCIQGNDSMRYSFCSNVIYENTREAITNCLKYANADRMDIIVKLLENTVEVYIFDNGKGCDNVVSGNGLKGMRERTEKIGGSIRFSSVNDNGFSIAMKFPITKGDCDD